MVGMACTMHLHLVLWVMVELSKTFRASEVESVQDFFYQVGHETMYAPSGKKHDFTKSCHPQTYQNYEQGQQKFGTFLINKVL